MGPRSCGARGSRSTEEQPAESSGVDAGRFLAWRPFASARPGFAAFAIVTLGLGIGATTASFTVLDRVVLRPLPYPAAERMAMVGFAGAARPDHAGAINAPMMMALQESPGPAEAIVGINRDFTLPSIRGEAERINAQRVTEGFFQFFGVRPAAGRLFVETDHRSGAPPVAILGHSFWMSRYGGDPGAIGSTIALDGVAHTVVGVLSTDFRPPEALLSLEAQDVWAPLNVAERSTTHWNAYIISAAVRLGPGASLEGMSALATRVAGNVRDDNGVPVLDRIRSHDRMAAESLHAVTVGEIGTALGRVFAAVALLSSRDAGTYGIAGLIVVVSGIGATLLPASRASRIDPACTLREDA